VRCSTSFSASWLQGHLPSPLLFFYFKGLVEIPPAVLKTDFPFFFAGTGCSTLLSPSGVPLYSEGDAPDFPPLDVGDDYHFSKAPGAFFFFLSFPFLLARPVVAQEGLVSLFSPSPSPPAEHFFLFPPFPPGPSLQTPIERRRGDSKVTHCTWDVFSFSSWRGEASPPPLFFFFLLLRRPRLHKTWEGCPPRHRSEIIPPPLPDLPLSLFSILSSVFLFSLSSSFDASHSCAERRGLFCIAVISSSPPFPFHRPLFFFFFFPDSQVFGLAR